MQLSWFMQFTGHFKNQDDNLIFQLFKIPIIIHCRYRIGHSSMLIWLSSDSPVSEIFFLYIIHALSL